MARSRGASIHVDVLARVAYFRSLPPAELRWLAARCAARALRPGQALFDEGQSCHGLHVIAEGTIEIRRVSVRGREQVLHSEGPGAALGEGPLFDRGGYIASAVATAPTRALFLRRGDVLELCRRRPEVALAMLEAMAGRVRRFAGIVGDLAFRPVAERVARYLCEAAAGSPGAVPTEVDLALTQAQLAARLGTVRELVARVLAGLEEAGVIARARRHIAIRDPERLAALARGEASISVPDRRHDARARRAARRQCRRAVSGPRGAV
jgi:CRP/FNR family transcriptional regulator